MEKQKRVVLSHIGSNGSSTTSLHPNYAVIKSAHNQDLDTQSLKEPRNIPGVLQLRSQATVSTSDPKLDGMALHEEQRVRPQQRTHYTFTGIGWKRPAFKATGEQTDGKRNISIQEVAKLLLVTAAVQTTITPLGGP